MADEQLKPADKPKSEPKSGWMNLVVDYGPLVVFFLVFKIYSPAQPDPIAEIGAMIRGTLAFMAASVIALAVSKFRLGKVSPMLWFSTALIIGFGALTVFFGNPTFVQLKPTIIYVTFGVALLVGFSMGKALLKYLLEAAFEGLNDAGWLKLSRNWGVFFLLLAVLNEVLRYYMNFGDWLAAKLWVFIPVTFLFTFTQIPMLLKHGMAADNADEVIENPPID